MGDQSAEIDATSEDRKRGIDYPPPPLADGTTYADQAWWHGKPSLEGTTDPKTFAEATELTWSRCWAYGEAANMSLREWHLMWPIVYGALSAVAAAWPVTEEDS